MNSNQILLNRIQTPDGTLLTSWNRHDYKTYTDNNGKLYMVDGGHDYLRRLVANPYTELSVYLSENHEENRKAAHWGTRGVDGKSPVRMVFLNTMSNDHIQSCLDTQPIQGSYMETLFKTELEYRKENNITIKETYNYIDPHVIGV